MNILPLYYVGLNLPLHDLVNLSLSCKKLNSLLLYSNQFWRHRYYQDFGPIDQTDKFKSEYQWTLMIKTPVYIAKGDLKHRPLSKHSFVWRDYRIGCGGIRKINLRDV